VTQTLFVKIIVNDDLKYITNKYSYYVNYLIDLLKPSDLEALDLLIRPFSEVKPKINYVLKPMRQNANLPRQFTRLAEKRSLSLLRTFCRKLKKSFVKYNEEVGEVLFESSSPKHKDIIDLNGRVSQIEDDCMKIHFNNRVICSKLDVNLPKYSKALFADLNRQKALISIPNVSNISGIQMGGRFLSLSSQSEVQVTSDFRKQQKIGRDNERGQDGIC